MRNVLSKFEMQASKEAKQNKKLVKLGNDLVICTLVWTSKQWESRKKKKKHAPSHLLLYIDKQGLEGLSTILLVVLFPRFQKYNDDTRGGMEICSP